MPAANALTLNNVAFIAALDITPVVPYFWLWETGYNLLWEAGYNMQTN